MADLEIRVLRTLVALADEGTMGRAARVLHLSQPALSKQIAQAEQVTGLRLFDRHSRGVTATAAGEIVIERARAVLREVDALSAEAERTRRQLSGRLRVGYIAQTVNEDVRRLLREFATGHPGVSVEKRQTDLRDLTAGLLIDEVDVAFLRQPLDAPGLVHVPVWSEPRVAVLPAGHALAGRAAVAVAELFDEPWVVNAGGDRAWQEYALALRARGDRPVLRGPVVHTIDEFLEAVLSEQAVGLAPASAARYYRRPGIAYVPVPDAEPSVCSLSWRADRALTPAARALVDLVRTSLPPGERISVGALPPSGQPTGSVTRDPR